MVEEIKDFSVILKYVPIGFDPLTHPGLEAKGAKRNQLPSDANVTFFFDYQQGELQLHLYLFCSLFLL